jgi:hypothetical protein
MKNILVLFLLFNSSFLFAQTSGCLVIEDPGTGQPARTRLVTGPILSNVNTTCFGFGSTIYSLPRYTGSPLSNPNQCQWNGSFSSNPSCLFVNPIGGGWVCGRLGTYSLVTCPIDDYIPYIILAFGAIGFIFIRKYRYNFV